MSSSYAAKMVKNEDDHNDNTWWSWFYMVLTCYTVVHLAVDMFLMYKYIAKIATTSRNAAPSTSPSATTTATSPSATTTTMPTMPTSSSATATAPAPLLGDAYTEVFAARAGVKIHLDQFCSGMIDPVTYTLCRKCAIQGLPKKKRSDCSSAETGKLTMRRCDDEGKRGSSWSVAE
jgi:hypothetical protein